LSPIGRLLCPAPMAITSGRPVVVVELTVRNTPCWSATPDITEPHSAEEAGVADIIRVIHDESRSWLLGRQRALENDFAASRTEL